MANNLAELRSTQNRPPRRDLMTLLADDKVKKGLACVATQHLPAERLLRIVVNAVSRVPKLAKCDPQTVLGCAMMTQALGLEPNTPLQLSYLIPYARSMKVDGQWTTILECQLMIGYRGFVTLAHRSPYVKGLKAAAVHANDHFLFEEISGRMEFARALAERGELIGAFARSQFSDDGDALITPLGLADIYKIRERSQTYVQARDAVTTAKNPKEKERAERQFRETPWVMWEDEMVAKTAIRRHAKMLPLAPDGLAIAAAYDSAADVGKVDMRALVEPGRVREIVGGNEDLPKTEPADAEDPPRESEDAHPSTDTTDLFTALREAESPKDLERLSTDVQGLPKGKARAEAEKALAAAQKRVLGDGA